MKLEQEESKKTLDFKDADVNYPAHLDESGNLVITEELTFTTIPTWFLSLIRSSEVWVGNRWSITGTSADTVEVPQGTGTLPTYTSPGGSQYGNAVINMTTGGVTLQGATYLNSITFRPMTWNKA